MLKLCCRYGRISLNFTGKRSIPKRRQRKAWRRPLGRAGRPRVGRPTHLSPAKARARAQAYPRAIPKGVNTWHAVPNHPMPAEGPDQEHRDPIPHQSEVIRGTRSRTTSGDGSEPPTLRWLANRHHPRAARPANRRAKSLYAVRVTAKVAPCNLEHR